MSFYVCFPLQHLIITGSTAAIWHHMVSFWKRSWHPNKRKDRSHWCCMVLLPGHSPWQLLRWGDGSCQIGAWCFSYPAPSKLLLQISVSPILTCFVHPYDPAPSKLDSTVGAAFFCWTLAAKLPKSNKNQRLRQTPMASLVNAGCVWWLVLWLLPLYVAYNFTHFLGINL